MTLSILQEADGDALAHLGRRALTSELVHRTQARAVHFTHGDVEMPSPFNTSLKVFELILSVVACLIIAGSLATVLLCAVCGCSLFVNEGGNISDTAVAVGVLSTPTHQACLEAATQPNSHACRTVEASAISEACMFTVPKGADEVENSATVQGDRGIQMLSASCSPASTSHPCSPCYVQMQQASKHDLLTDRCELIPVSLSSASEGSVEGAEVISAPSTSENRRRGGIFNMTPAQRRMLEGTNEFINSELPCTVSNAYEEHAFVSDSSHALSSKSHAPENAWEACTFEDKSSSSITSSDTVCEAGNKTEASPTNMTSLQEFKILNSHYSSVDPEASTCSTAHSITALFQDSDLLDRSTVPSCSSSGSILLDATARGVLVPPCNPTANPTFVAPKLAVSPAITRCLSAVIDHSLVHAANDGTSTANGVLGNVPILDQLYSVRSHQCIPSKLDFLYLSSQNDT